MQIQTTLVQKLKQRDLRDWLTIVNAGNLKYNANVCQVLRDGRNYIFRILVHH